MARVTFLPGGTSIDVAAGTTILAAARQAGVLIESPCNCAGTCGKCRVQVDPAWHHRIRQAAHHDVTVDDQAKGTVLACVTEVLDDIEVFLPSSARQPAAMQIIGQGKALDVIADAAIRKRYDPLLQRTDVLALNRQTGEEECLGSETGNTVADLWGVVVDIGTTTLVVSLVSLHTGQETAKSSALNPQSLHAQDVLSRIKLAGEPQGLERLYAGLIGELHDLIGQVCRQSGVDRRQIYEVVFSGNTCMLHLATGQDPTSLGRYPYDPLERGGRVIEAQAHGLAIAPWGRIYLPPIISAYVGADITAGVVAAELASRVGTTLFVDIGTNGEMILARDGRLLATSTAAGPAFEGMNIACGMRAAAGAVERFTVEDDGTLSVETIGQAPAVGICGSGLIDLVGELVRHGVLQPTGRWADPGRTQLLPALAERLQPREGKTVFYVDGDVYLTQKDVRQVQLAKGAVRAGIEMMLKREGLTLADVDQVLIAGSFGYHLRARSLIDIGLLPADFAGKIEFVGNTALTGGQALLVHEPLRTTAQAWVDTVDVVELAHDPGFDRVFVESLNF
ncbi:ASKHA domain-containing protein [Heliophilum fasciatum]|uniref:Uncharacterized 2Fe-2S/4Fe-4S cluster protein (DUF4445 family) n=1 Tax=Heliophilum fasciatum TaxID=35700 RepID=A0A4R2SCU5_9FIRM|nr:ASKHA domain-containing protein [Heliophilum fasciatum]MCW2276654.1 uncharacterized 2Fe-2S/4Fe-4S cluster protein (DUF4445 family) [Heliophilum fasciatum]TCP68965.1 uncharacterized 2Fe-2S/4Fe-4S cluster protein (DUF4445 family) [Heliophilum fasciatum]